MPGFLTPERRQKAKQRSRSNVAGGSKRGSPNKNSSNSSIGSSSRNSRSSKNKPPPHSDIPSSNSLDGSSAIGDPRTITPNSSAESPRRSSSRSSRGGGRWKDVDESNTEASTPPPYFSPSSRGSPASYYGIRHSPLPIHPTIDYNNSSRSSTHSIREEFMYASDEEMPMDEMMGLRKKQQQQQQQQVRSPSPKQSIATYRSVTPTKEVSDVLGLSNIMAMVSPSNWNTTEGTDKNDTILKEGGKESISVGSNDANGKSRVNAASTTGIQRIIAALNSGSTASRPPNLNREECILWDSLQTAMVNDRNEHLSKRRALEVDLQKSSSLLDEVERREMELEREVTQAKNIRADMEQKYTAMAIVVENQQSRNKKTNADDKEDNKGETDIGKREMLNLQLQQIDLLKQELQTKDTLMKKQQDSHNTEVLAIQRVLADITTEKLKLERMLENQKDEVVTAVKERDSKEDSNEPAPAPISNKELDEFKKKLEISREETEAARREADEKAKQIAVLESDLEVARSQAKTNADEQTRLLNATEASSDEVVNLKEELECLESTKRELDNLLNKTMEEVTAGKLEIEKMKVEKMEADVVHASALSDVNRLNTDNMTLQQNTKQLKREREEALTEAEKLKAENNLLQQDVEKLKKDEQRAVNELRELRKARQHAVAEVDKAILEAKAIEARPVISPSNSVESENSSTSTVPKHGVSVEEFEELKKKLADTTLSLETSKKIIASLENANGSFAADSRAKIKDKEEELSVVQKESEERKRNLDSLATELRDLQRKQGDIDNADRQTKVQLIRQRALMDHLDTTLTDLQAAVVVHESSVAIQKSTFSKNSNIEEISEILGDALHAISSTLEMSEQFVDDVDDSSVADSNVDYAELNSEVGRYIDTIITNDREATSRGLKHELEQKKVAVKRLEEALKKQNEEMRRMRSQSHNSDNTKLREEIHRLRQQCTTNLEVLARKERELSVLRSSLNVDENESGYISDDASDEEDEEGGTDVASIISAAKLNSYSSADAEAYATILSQANGRIEIPGNQIQEIESLKKDLMEALGEKESASKELQLRRESLANAKMIISSLEKANKGMMEDLRSRLQDSNNAISSLLDKSKAQESISDDLRDELKRLEREKLEDREKYEAELKELRGEEGNDGALEEKKEGVSSLETSPDL